MEKRLKASHGTVHEAPAGSLFGYFGWPTVARTDDGATVVAASGFRTAHVCPWGKTVLFSSRDGGGTWSPPAILNDTPLDDRDAGLLPLQGNGLLVSWFSSDTRRYLEWCEKGNPLKCSDAVSLWTDEFVDEWLGSFVRIRDGRGKWGGKIPVKVTSPHGPTKLRDGRILYLGKAFGSRDSRGALKFKMDNLHDGDIQAIESQDGGAAWRELGTVARPQDGFFCEAHAVEMEDGRILGMLRKGRGENDFSIYQTESADGGATWSKPAFICYGSPPHLLAHSSKALICVYGYRRNPFGQRAMFSRDSGKTWSQDWIIRDDGPSDDLGYPSTVELDDGSLLSVYYQSTGKGKPASVLCTRWELPAL